MKEIYHVSQVRNVRPLARNIEPVVRPVVGFFKKAAVKVSLGFLGAIIVIAVWLTFGGPILGILFGIKP